MTPTSPPTFPPTKFHRRLHRPTFSRERVSHTRAHARHRPHARHRAPRPRSPRPARRRAGGGTAHGARPRTRGKLGRTERERSGGERTFTGERAHSTHHALLTHTRAVPTRPRHTQHGGGRTHVKTSGETRTKRWTGNERMWRVPPPFECDLRNSKSFPTAHHAENVGCASAPQKVGGCRA